MVKNNPMPDDGYLRINQLVGCKEANKELAPIIPVSKATIWSWVKQGRFPAPIKLSPSVTVWRVEDVRAYLAQGDAA